MKLDTRGLICTPSDLVVKAFDGSKRNVFGEIVLPIKVGPEIFEATFYIMDI